jgi:antitoxin HicB
MIPVRFSIFKDITTMTRFYPIRLTRDTNGTILVSFPDFPEAHTFGDTKAEAVEHAVDALETVIDAYIRAKRPIPEPSVKGGSIVVALPALVETKIALYRTMHAARVTKSELARRLGVHPPQVDRLLEMHHASQLSQVESAFKALGKRVVVDVVDAPANEPRVRARRRAAHAAAR